MQYSISEGNLPTLDMELEAGEGIYTEAGGMSWMTPNIAMETNTHGGVMKGMMRAVAGESLFMTTYTCEEGTGTITFCNELPGKIVPMDLTGGQEIIAQRDTFMCGSNGVSIEIALNKRLGAGFFGGEGFILQRIAGEGTAFLEFCGSMITYELEEGQVLKVDPGHIGAFDASVTYDIARVKGVTNMLFGSEGIFLATMSGPGRVWLQSMPLQKLADKISTKLPPPSK